MNDNAILYDQLHKWLAAYGYAHNTAATYGKIIQNFFRYLESFEIPTVTDVNTELLMRFIYTKGGGEGYSPASVRTRKSALSLFYAWAYENRLVRKNLITEYKRGVLRSTLPNKKCKAKQQNEIIYLSPVEQEKLLRFDPGNDFLSVRNKCIVVLLLASPLFADELVNLPIAALDLESGYLHIGAHSNNRNREISLDLSLCENSCRKWLQELKEKSCAQNNLLLFATKDVSKMTKRMLHKIISQYITAAGIKKNNLGPEVLRKTAIYNMFRSGKNLEEIQNATGIKTLAQLDKYRLGWDMEGQDSEER